ncbi:hypothetical protein BGZ75_005810 [Mortierella antarctica]|nr:hypothetical protein BGZ75_005810 [Mortierella antarctica]
MVRDKRRYGSLDAAALEDQGALKSMSTEDSRPLSSMEDAEEWSGTTVPTTDTVASGRHPLDAGQVQLPVVPTLAVTDQIGSNKAAAVSNDQQSIHPLQLGPEPRLTFASSPLLQINTSLPRIMAHSPASPTASVDRWHLVSPLGSPTDAQQSPFVNTTLQQAPAQKLRKKSTLASKIRKVFNKPIGSVGGSEQDLEVANTDVLQQLQTLEDIISMSTRDDAASLSMFGSGFVPSSLLKNQRGSVSSTSSADTTMSAAPGEFGIGTPSTSPEMSPSGSPKVRSLSLQLPSAHHAPASSDQDVTEQLDLVPDVEDTNCEPNAEGAHKAGKRQNLEPIQTRTVKKRLSFASISSFFNPRSDELLAKAYQKRDQRASSVPNVEHPLVIVGRQIAGFPRRHSLNDMQVGGGFHQKQEQVPLYKFVNPPWDKDGASAQAAAAAAELLASSSSKNKSSPVESNTASSEDAPEITRKKSKIHSVFAKQSRRKSKSGPTNAIVVATASDAMASPATAPPARPLRSALVNRHQRQLSFKRTSQVNRTSIYGQPQIHFDLHSQGPMAPSSRRHSVCEPLVDLSPDAGPTVSRRTSAEDQQQQQQQIRHSMERIVGPTRHRRQSSIAGRHASQQGNYPATDRKPHRLSMRYSTSEEFDIFQYADAFAPVHPHPQFQQPQQFQQLQAQQYHYQGGYLTSQQSHDYEAFAPTSSTSPAPRMFPVHQGEDSTSFNGNMLSPMSLIPSRGGSFSSASGAEAQSQQAIPGSGVGTGVSEVQSPSTSGPASKETSPVLAASSSSNLNSGTPAVKIVPRNPALANVMNHQHRRSSYQQGESPITASNYNSKRNSLIVAPVSRLPVDHSLMMESHQGFINSVNSHHQYLQHQQQIQIQQQLHVQQQQFQRNQQQFQHHYLSDQHHQQAQQQQQQQQQQFMNGTLPHSPSHALHIPLQEQPYHPHPYSPYQYQFNQQQQQQHQHMPSHLHYPSSPQHAAPYHPHAHSQAYNPGHMSMTSSNHFSYSNTLANNNTNFRSSPPSPSVKTIHLARPTRQLQFSTAEPIIHTTWTSDQYDRTSDPNITAHRLTPAIAQKIKLELNQFKSQEMVVHQESRTHTHFFV